MKILKYLFSKKDKSIDSNDHNDVIDWDKIDLDKANFILQEGEKLMQNVSQNYNYLDSKSSIIRTFLIASLAALFGVFKFVDPSYQALIAILIGSFCLSLAVLSITYKTEKFPTIGSSPKELLKSKYSGEDLRWLICCQMQTYSSRIDKAKKINAHKGIFINIALSIISVSFFVSSYMLIKSIL